MTICTCNGGVDLSEQSDPMPGGAAVHLRGDGGPVCGAPVDDGIPGEPNHATCLACLRLVAAEAMGYHLVGCPADDVAMLDAGLDIGGV